VITDELRTALESGNTLAQVAQSKGTSQATLVDRLVAAETARLAAVVTAGRLTQAQAEAMTAELRTRITELVTTSRPAAACGLQDADMGPGDRYGGGADDNSVPSAPGDNPSTSSSSTT
jgi:hypothetical protein